jgi:hypothetical protein
MSPDRVAVDEGSEQQPSPSAIGRDNLANFRLKYLVLDDINVDLISVIAVIFSLVGIFTSYFSNIKVLVAATALILPIRTFFPRSTKPTGLVLITGSSSGIGAELAYIFAEHGHDLVLVGQNEEQLERVKRTLESK